MQPKILRPGIEPDQYQGRTNTHIKSTGSQRRYQSRDQILALIDSALYAGQVEQAEAQLDKAKTEEIEINHAIAIAQGTLHCAEAQLFASRAAFEDAERIYTRLNTLVARRIAAGAEKDTALARRDQTAAGVRMAEAQIETAKAQLKRALVQK
jgi:multidrug resistance efflux pump